MQVDHRKDFWRDAFAIQGSITPFVLPYVLSFGGIACVICGISWVARERWGIDLGLEVAPFELAGAALGLLLILRTNSGYDRWWEARKLWGGIVNQSRNLAIGALSYGPRDSSWQEQFVRWVAAFPHATRCSLRNERPCAEVAELVGDQAAAEVARAQHMPSFISLKLANLLKEACDSHDMDRFAFLQLDRERMTLIDHIGACERILKTPLPQVYAIKIRRFIAIFLLTLPLALLHRLSSEWLVPIITMLVAYPLVSLDQIGVELQNPFSRINLSHLPLNEITGNIERNVLELSQESRAETNASPGRKSLEAIN